MPYGDEVKKNIVDISEKLQKEVDSIMGSTPSDVIFFDEQDPFVDLQNHDKRIQEYSLSPRIITHSHYKAKNPKRFTDTNKIVIYAVRISKQATKKIAQKISFIVYFLFRKYEF